MSVGQGHVFGNVPGTTLPSLWGSDTIKMILCTNSITPSTSDTGPRYGSGGSTNYTTSEVAAGGNYNTGGISVTTSSSQSSNVFSLTATSPISLSANASNPTGVYYGVFYDSSDANKRCLGWIDLSSGSGISTVSGLQVNLNGVASGTQPVFQSTST